MVAGNDAGSLTIDVLHDQGHAGLDVLQHGGDHGLVALDIANGLEVGVLVVVGADDEAAAFNAALFFGSLHHFACLFNPISF